MKVKNLRTYGVEESVVASGYPMQTESTLALKTSESGVCTPDENDWKRMSKLGKTKAGSGHDQALTGCIVQFDLTFSNKAWVEAERYHFFDFVSSQSTMHRLPNFDLDLQYNEYVDSRIVEIMKELKETYNKDKSKTNYLKLLYSNPAGFELTARMTTNYRQIKTIVLQRYNHRLPEWRDFCQVMVKLPYFTELTGINICEDGGLTYGS